MVNNLFLYKEKKILFPLCQRFIYAIKYHIIIKYMHNYKNFWMSFKNVFNVLSWDRNKLFFSEKEMKTSKCKEGTHSSSSGSYPVTYFSDSKDINLKPPPWHQALNLGHWNTQRHSYTVTVPPVTQHFLWESLLSTRLKQRLILCLKCILNRQGV